MSISSNVISITPYINAITFRSHDLRLFNNKSATSK